MAAANALLASGIAVNLPLYQPEDAWPALTIPILGARLEVLDEEPPKYRLIQAHREQLGIALSLKAQLANIRGRVEHATQQP